MSKYDLYSASLITGTILGLLGLFYHFQQHPGAGDILGTALLISLYWFIMGLAGVLRSGHLSPAAKVLWVAAFLIVSWLAGVVWYFREIRPRQREEKQEHNGSKEG